MPHGRRTIGFVGGDQAFSLLDCQSNLVPYPLYPTHNPHDLAPEKTDLPCVSPITPMAPHQKTRLALRNTKKS